LTVDLDEPDEGAVPASRNAAVSFSLPNRSDGNGDEDEDEDEDEDDHEEPEETDRQRNQPFGVTDQDEEDGEDEEEEAAAETSDVELPSDVSEDEDEPDELDELDGLDSFVEQLASSDEKRKLNGNGLHRDKEGPKKRRVLLVIPGPSLSNAGGLGLKSSEHSIQSLAAPRSK